MLNKICILYLSYCLCLPLTVYANDFIQQGLIAFRQGITSQAIESWKTALLEEKLSFSQRIEVSNYLAEAYQEIGDYPLAHQILQ